MTDAKRQTLKEKVEAGQARVQAKTENTTTIVDRAGEKAIEAKDKFVSFAKEHPIVTVAGALAMGVVISGLFKKSPTRKVANKAAGRAAGIAAVGAQLAMAYAQQALSAADKAAHNGAEKLDDLGDTARHLRRDATDKAAELRKNARITASDAGKRLAQVWHDKTN